MAPYSRVSITVRVPMIPNATEFYYRGLTDRHAESATRLELTIANAEVRDLSQNLANKDARKQAGIV
jgi:aspartate racemase